ncbi:MAG: hypothetical protein MUF50_01430 [Planctomycetes bacterium]|jgi:hypothetical protein|nr:hypothetical protein [Planctomycetota bacterium]
MEKKMSSAEIEKQKIKEIDRVCQETIKKLYKLHQQKIELIKSYRRRVEEQEI